MDMDLRESQFGSGRCLNRDRISVLRIYFAMKSLTISLVVAVCSVQCSHQFASIFMRICVCS